MAFVATFTPVSAGSSFTKNVTSASPCPLGLGNSRPTSPDSSTIRMSGMSDFSRRLIFGGSGKDYTGSNPGGVQPGVGGAPDVTSPSFVPQQPSASTPATYAAKPGEGPYVLSFRAGSPAIFQYAKDGTTDTVKPRGAYKADRYMASCVRNQYKAMANPAGVYSPSCTEGTTKLQADESRELANMNEFRMMQRGSIKTYSDYFENRKQAIKLAHGCHYEETLVSNLPNVARAMIRGYSEAKSICVRYGTGIEYVQECGEEAQIASAYMASCVDKQYKQMACPTGEYATTCAEGNTAGLAEFKRVQALSARYRAGMMTTLAKTQARYDARLFARSMFRTCNYEEDVFNKFPAVAAAMRGSSY